MGIIRKNGVDFTGGGTYTVNKVELISSPVGYPSPAKYLYGTVWSSDQDTYYSDNDFVGKLVVYKPIVAGVNSICLPFETTAEAIAGAGAAAYEFTHATASILSFTKVETMTANTPYLLVATATKDLITVNNVKLRTKDPATITPEAGFSMIGNYTHNFIMQDNWGINGSGNLQKGGSDAKLSSFGAYFTGSYSAAGGAVKALFVDDATGITTMKEMKGNGLIYNLAGQRVSHPTHGFYVVNGKKIMIR